MRLRSRELFECVRTEGGLLPSDLLQRIADNDRSLEGLTPESYHLASGERLNEAITRSWNRLLGAWAGFSAEREKLAAGETGAKLTRERWLHVLFDELGYGRLVQQEAVVIDEKRYPVFTQWQHSPIHLVGCGVPLDRRTPGVQGAAGQSPHSLLQELLNRSPERLWGFVTNGLSLRVLRDNVSLTRQAYVELDLESIFGGGVYSDFVLLWLVCHQSRVEAPTPSECRLEQWCRTAAQSGVQALDQLRFGVERAIAELGSGFLAHPANAELHAELRSGGLDAQDYYRQLLRLVYRLLFLFVAEDRGALLAPEAGPTQRRRYLVHYSTRRLRTLAARRRGGGHHDLYEQLKVVSNCLHHDGHGGLGLPALGSYLWSPEAVGLLGAADLPNTALLGAIRELAYVEDRGVRRAVDFRNLGAEELGSIYESLLELHPRLHRETAKFELATAAGHERKTTGSYYTPTSLITTLLDSALDPVLDAAAEGEDPEKAILALTVCDPACGSGHFLIAAANRIAKRLAAVRTGDSEPAPEAMRAALRDVIGRCIHGVDVNPMAVELCKVSLWLEALEPGKPLSFLDHRIVVGNSLLGTTPALVESGIPDDAFKPILGDDKKVTTVLRKRNATERSGQLEMEPADLLGSAHELADLAGWVDEVPDSTLAGIAEREERHRALLASDERRRAKLLADLWCAAFVQRKCPGEPALTQRTFDAIAAGDDSALPAEDSDLWRLIERLRFHHWHVAFPQVFRLDEEPGPDGWAGGFDVVLGNPPWERVKLQEKEFFATRSPEIATAANKAARERMITALEEEDPALLEAFHDAKRDAEGASHLLRASGRYPLCGRGDVNTYAVFAEAMRSAIGPAGRAGVIVPTGIATDDTTKLFFADIMDSGSLISLFDFENRERAFPGVDSRIKFCLLTLAGPARLPGAPAEFCFFATRVEHLDEPDRRFTLTAEDIELLNPNTRTCPVFRSRRDAEITKGIYRRVPVLVREGDPDGNPWGVSFSTMFHMANDSRLFRTRERLDGDGWTLNGNVFVRNGARMLPLYEAKMIHHFDHQWATYEPDGTVRNVTGEEKADPDFVVMPRYWVPEAEVEARLPLTADKWALGWREVARNTDERTVISGFGPRVGYGHKFLILRSGEPDGLKIALGGVLSSFALDYVVRNKVSSSLGYFVMKQLPLPSPELPGLGELEPLVRGLIDPGLLGADTEAENQVRDEKARANSRAELDARVFHLYGLDRDDTAYILDTFPIVRRKDEQRFGDYRTKRLILERYDAFAEAIASGESSESPIDPPTGSSAAAHGAAAR